MLKYVIVKQKGKSTQQKVKMEIVHCWFVSRTVSEVGFLIHLMVYKKLFKVLFCGNIGSYTR